MSEQNRSEQSNASASAVASGELLGALREWRDAEKRHALIILGELEGDRAVALEKSTRTLHRVRCLADKIPDLILVPAITADLIRKVFVPRNPNKMRGAAPEVVMAAKDFIALCAQAQSPILTFNHKAKEK